MQHLKSFFFPTLTLQILVSFWNFLEPLTGLSIQLVSSISSQSQNYDTGHSTSARTQINLFAVCYTMLGKKGITETETKTSSHDSCTLSLFFLWHRAQIQMKVVETTWERDGGRGWRKKKERRGQLDMGDKRVEKGGRLTLIAAAFVHISVWPHCSDSLYLSHSISHIHSLLPACVPGIHALYLQAET